MSAYLIVCRQDAVTDPAAIAEYQRLASADGPSPNLKVLAAYGQLTALEGDAPDGVVVLEFTTVEAAKAWYNRPSYQAAVVHRLKAAKFQSFIVEGFAAPA